MAANQGTAWGDNATDRRTPHVSSFKISINTELMTHTEKNIQARRKNLGKFVDVGIQIWSNFYY
jgi:hypothetical protein